MSFFHKGDDLLAFVSASFFWSTEKFKLCCG